MSTAASEPQDPRPVQTIGRYALYDEIAAGGMATVHFGRLLGPVGFTRTVAIKRLHPNLAKDPEFTAMFLDEARLAARIRHPNVVQTLDVVARQGELFLVMDYVHGESLSTLVYLANQKDQNLPLGVTGNLISGVLQGLHAAHEARSERGDRLHIVHRDVSPQNILVGVDGIPRLLDFGIAKAMGRAANTRGAQLKGKISYMSPEQITGGDVDRRTDIWGAAIVLWTALTGRKLFSANTDAETLYKILDGEIDPPSRYNKEVSPELDAVVLRGLEREPADRFADAHEMVVAFEKTTPMVSQREVAEWVEGIAGKPLANRASRVAEIESSSTDIRGLTSDAPPRRKNDEPAVSVANLTVPALGENVESSYVAGSAVDTLPPPAPAPVPKKRRWLFPAAAAATLLLVALGSWRLARVGAPAPAASSPSVSRTTTAEDSVPQPSAQASTPTIPSATTTASASASALPVASADKGGPGKVRTGSTGKQGTSKSTGGGIYARE